MTNTEAVNATSTFVLIGQGNWGSGDTLEEAKANFRKEGGRLGKGYGLLEFGPESEFKGVDSFGFYHWTGPEPIVTEF